MTKLIYLPANSAAAEYNSMLEYNGKKLSWWTEDGYFNYPNILMSFFFINKEQDIRKKINFPEKGIFFGDSGGFSVVTQDAQINPRDVIEWMNKYCDIGVILDIPPYDFSGTKQFGGSAAKLFDKSLKETYENAKIMHKLWNKKFMLYSVMQGETYEQKIQWLEKLLTIGEFSGCALSPKPSTNLFQIASHMLIAINKKIKNIHILQVSGIKMMATIYYISKLFNCFELVTFDSASFIQLGSGLRKIYPKPLQPPKTDRYNENYKGKMDCDCPICQDINKDISVLGNKKYAGQLLSLHNLYIKVKETELFEQMSLEQLEKVIKNNQLIRFIKLCKTNLQEQKYLEENIFCDFFNTKPHHTQRNLFAF